MGRLGKGVTAKDVMLHILATHARRQETLDRVMEFGGPGLASLSPDERATLANMATECSAKAGVVEADEETLRWIAARRPGASLEELRGKVVRPDPGATYAGGVHTIDLGRIRPMVATPGDQAKGIPSDPTNGAVIADLGEVPIDIAYGGSCTAGKEDDLDMYAKVMKEALDAGLLPETLHVRDPPRHEHEIRGAVADHLISEVDVPAPHVASGGYGPVRVGRRRFALDLLKPPRGGRLRLHSELASERLRAPPVLAQGRRPPPLPGVQLHERTVGALAQRIESEQTEAGFHRPLRQPRGEIHGEQLPQRIQPELSQPLPFRGEPVVERRLVDPESVEEFASIKARAKAEALLSSTS